VIGGNALIGGVSEGFTAQGAPEHGGIPEHHLGAGALVARQLDHFADLDAFFVSAVKTGYVQRHPVRSEE
jgi:hypothetical protein